MLQQAKQGRHYTKPQWKPPCRACRGHHISAVAVQEESEQRPHKLSYHLAAKGEEAAQARCVETPAAGAANIKLLPPRQGVIASSVLPAACCMVYQHQR